MTKKTAAKAADPHARLAAAEAEVAKASAAVAEIAKPLLQTAITALDGAGEDLAATLKTLHADLTSDPTAQQAIANVWMIHASARQILRARLAAAEQAIAAVAQP